MYPSNNGLLGQRPTGMLPQGPNMGGVPPRYSQPPMPPQPPVNIGIPNQVQSNSPLVSPMSNQPYNPVPTPSSSDYSYTKSAQYDSPAQPDVAALNVVNQLQLLLNVERLKQVHSGSHPSTPDFNRNSTNTSPHRASSSSPSRSKSALPSHWKTATDAEGRVYYYHAISR